MTIASDLCWLHHAGIVHGKQAPRSTTRAHMLLYDFGWHYAKVTMLLCVCIWHIVYLSRTPQQTLYVKTWTILLLSAYKWLHLITRQCLQQILHHTTDCAILNILYFLDPCSCFISTFMLECSW